MGIKFNSVKKIIGMTIASVVALNAIGIVAPTSNSLTHFTKVNAANKAATFVEKKLVTIKKSNLYTSASNKSKVKTTLKKSEKVTATSQKGSFYKVSYGSLTGYIYKNNLKAINPSEGETIEETYFLTNEPASLYESFSLASNVLKILPFSKKISTTYKIGDFYKVTYGSVTGYVHKSQLSPFDAPTPTKSPTTKSMDSDAGASHIKDIFEQKFVTTSAEIYVGKNYDGEGYEIAVSFDRLNKKKGAIAVSFSPYFKQLSGEELDIFMKNSITMTEVFFGEGSKYAIELRDLALKSLDDKKSRLVLVDNRVFNLDYYSGFMTILPV